MFPWQSFSLPSSSSLRRPLLKPQRFFHEKSLNSSYEHKTPYTFLETEVQDLLKPLYKNPLIALMWVWPHLAGPSLKNLCWPVKFSFYGKNTQRLLYLEVKKGSELWVSQSLHLLKNAIERYWNCPGQLDLRLKKQEILPSSRRF